jgi:peptidoglycan/xylan/chitin deacetylase (PgdA/CDA1 family)
MTVYLVPMFVTVLAGFALAAFFFVVCSILLEYRRDRVPMLLYHRLLPKDRVQANSMTEFDRSYVTFDTAFTEQMTYLHKNHYTTISLDEFLAYQDGRGALPPKPIVVTFDDGFASNYHYAFPVLKKFGMTATIFVTPDTESENFKKYQSTDSPLSATQMCEMSANGISIQSHGMTHRYLMGLDENTVRWELLESKRVLEQIIGKPVSHLAIPSGAYDRTVRKLAIAAGYKAVFCMLKGTNNKRSDRFALRRLVIARDLSLDDFRRILGSSTASYLRLESSIQNALLHLLGPRGLDALRDTIYESRLGSILRHSQRRHLVRSFAVLVVLFFSSLAIVVSRLF